MSWEFNRPVFIITCVVARLTFFLKPVHYSSSALLSVTMSGTSRGSQSAEGGGVASYLPTTYRATVFGEHFDGIGVE